jgi:hypothetical protein
MYIIHKQEELVKLEKCFVNFSNDDITKFIDYISKYINYPSFVVDMDNMVVKHANNVYMGFINNVMVTMSIQVTINDCKYFIPGDTIIKNIVFTCPYLNIIDFHFANFNEILNKHETFLLFLKSSTDKNSLIDMFNTDVMFVISTYYRAICQ